MFFSRWATSLFDGWSSNPLTSLQRKYQDLLVSNDTTFYRSEVQSCAQRPHLFQNSPIRTCPTLDHLGSPLLAGVGNKRAMVISCPYGALVEYTGPCTLPDLFIVGQIILPHFFAQKFVFET